MSAQAALEDDRPEGSDHWSSDQWMKWATSPGLTTDESQRRIQTANSARGYGGHEPYASSPPLSPPAPPRASNPTDWLTNTVTADAWDATASVTPPTICRIDGTAGALFSPGRVSRLFGSSGSAKSWIAKLGTAEVLADGGSVLYLDGDGVWQDFRDHLKAMGVSRDDALSGRLHYSRIEGSLLGSEVRALLTSTNWSFVVIDGFNVALTVSGFNGSEDDGVTAFFTSVLNPAADTGAAVVVIDHMKKDGETDHGSVFKRNNLTGTDYAIKRKSLIAPGIRGYSALSLTPKDRSGWATSQHASRGKTQDDPFAYVLVDSTGTSGVATVVSLQLDAPLDVMVTAAASQAMTDADTLRALLRDYPAGFASGAKVRQALGRLGKSMDGTRINAAGALLEANGEVTRVRSGSSISLRPVVTGGQP